jgi:hypothetical protein
MGVRPPRELLDWLRGYAPAVRALGLRLRVIVADELAPCHEYIFWMRSKIVLMYGSSERVIDDNICSIGVFKRHVDLVFKRGADLDDPDGILQGTGKGMRHLKITSSADLRRAEIRTFLRKARRHASLGSASRGRTRSLTTRVKPRAVAKPAPLPRLF